MTREVEAREARTSRVSQLYGEITSATREFLRAVVDVDRHEDWREEGFTGCAEWLGWQIGIKVGSAREWVRTARALESLPRISEAMDRGAVSFSKVRALTRVATPESEESLLKYAHACSTADLERLVRSWKTMGREGEVRHEGLRHRRRRFSVFQDNDGMYVVRGRLTPEVGALLMRAVEAASDELFKACPADQGQPEPAQLRADAVGQLAERALANRERPISGARADRYQVMLHVDRGTVTEHGESGRSELEDGTRVSAETSRRICCDASRVDVLLDSEGAVVDVGRRTRTVPPRMRRALEARDRGCRFPGCGLRFTDAHHVVHWADGGDTSLDNLVLLCARHHRAVHEGGYTVCSGKGGDQVVFFTPDGRAFGGGPPPPEVGPAPLESLVRRNRARGMEPDWWGCEPTVSRWADTRELEAAAREALDQPA